MTREEAKYTLLHIYEQCAWGSECEEYGCSVCEDALNMAIEALDERKVELFDDGTLVVNVKEGAKVGRVLIEGDDHFGGLYYADSGERSEP